MNQSSNGQDKVSLQINLRLVCALLLISNIALLALWQPWQGIARKETRKYTSIGQASVMATPDEFVFSPYWERASLSEVTSLNETIVVKLKELGVAENKIKNNASSYDDRIAPMPTNPASPEGEITQEKSMLNLTITVTDKDLAQKVQNYLLTTSPKGSVTPYAQFSKDKQRELEDRVRVEAIADAKRRAESEARELGEKVGKVIEVKDGYPANNPFVYADKSTASMSVEGSSSPSLGLLPGENEYAYTIEVVFELVGK